MMPYFKCPDCDYDYPTTDAFLQERCIRYCGKNVNDFVERQPDVIVRNVTQVNAKLYVKPEKKRRNKYE